MSAALGLFRLQQVDRQLDQAQSRLALIRQALGNDSELRAGLDQVEMAGATQRESERALREAESQVKSQQIKIEQSESSLYGGRVHNPKELQDLQNEIAALKRHRAPLEERQFDAMLEVENAQTALKVAEAVLSGLQSRRGEAQRALIEEQSSLTKTTERLQSERLAVISDIANQPLEIYGQLRQQKRGIAVVEVNDNACSACGTTLNAALQQSARSATQMANCPSCGRILYAN